MRLQTIDTATTLRWGSQRPTDFVLLAAVRDADEHGTFVESMFAPKTVR